MSIGNNIRRIRESKGMRSADLAKAIGVSPPVVSQWENDPKREPKKEETLRKIADGLGVQLFDLVYDPEVFKQRTREWAMHCDALGFDFTDLEIVNSFHKLNTTGKQEALKRVKELTEISRYQADQSDLDLEEDE